MAQKNPTDILDGFETVEQEAGLKITFDNPGDVFVGVYRGTSTVENPGAVEEKDKEFTVAHFTGVFPEEVSGEFCDISPGFKLSHALDKIKPGDLVKIEYVNDVSMGSRGRNDMKNFRVGVKRG